MNSIILEQSVVGGQVALIGRREYRMEKTQAEILESNHPTELIQALRSVGEDHVARQRRSPVRIVAPEVESSPLPLEDEVRALVQRREPVETPLPR